MSKIIPMLFVLSFASSLGFAEEAPPPAPAAPPIEAPPNSKKEYDHFAGFLMGSGRGTGSTDAKGIFLYGARAGYGFFRDKGGVLSVGPVVQLQKDTSTLGSVAVSTRSVFSALEVLYREAFGTGAYFGARAGFAYLKIEATTATASIQSDNTTFAVGPVAGYEFPISDRVSLGLDLSWISIQGGSFPLGNLNVPYGNINIFTYQAGLNFRF